MSIKIHQNAMHLHYSKKLTIFKNFLHLQNHSSYHMYQFCNHKKTPNFIDITHMISSQKGSFP